MPGLCSKSLINLGTGQIIELNGCPIASFDFRSFFCLCVRRGFKLCVYRCCSQEIDDRRNERPHGRLISRSLTLTVLPWALTVGFLLRYRLLGVGLHIHPFLHLPHWKPNRHLVCVTAIATDQPSIQALKQLDIPLCYISVVMGLNIFGFLISKFALVCKVSFRDGSTGLEREILLNVKGKSKGVFGASKGLPTSG